MKSIVLALFFTIFMLSSVKAEVEQFMKVSPDLIITEDNQRCFEVKPGYSRKDSAKWVPYCGRFINFFYEQGYEYTLKVDNYDPHARVIKVIKTIGRDNIESYRKQLVLKALKQKRDLAEERVRLLANVRSQIEEQVFRQMEKYALALSRTQMKMEDVVFYNRDEYEYDYDYYYE